MPDLDTRSDTATSKRDRASIPNASELATEGQRPADPFVEPLSLLASQLGQIAASILQLERSHSDEMENAAAQLRHQISTDLHNQHQGRFEAEIQVLRGEFEQRMCSATAQWEAERQSLLNEIEHLRGRNSSGVAQEVAQTEAALESLQKKIGEMLDDPTVELSRVIPENARQEQLQAYLKGLKFNA
jgi:hypothetical protein